MTANTRDTACSTFFEKSLIEKYDLNGPRYTSYPTAPQFSEQFGEKHWRAAIVASNAKARPLSLYFHLPFCDTVCYYCACNKIITANKQRVEAYLQNLIREIALQARRITPRPVAQLHWGGGTPTYFNDAQLKTLMHAIQQYFPLSNGEHSIEIHPKDVNPARIHFLRQLGFNRLSMGVQDFDAEVQQAVNRFNSKAQVAAIIRAAKQAGFNSTSIDLIYGLPKQTPKNFAETLRTIVELKPDRVSLFNYAHMPQLFKVQKQIDSQALPSAAEKLEILQNSAETLMAAGYTYIGMDHFALPHDELAIAQRNGSLHRNFQGYTTHGGCDLLGFGVSSISAVGSTYSQNHKTVDAYEASIEQGELPVSRGVQLSADDRIRQQVIQQLICQFTIDTRQFAEQHQHHFWHYFAKERQTLSPLEQDGIVEISEGRLSITPKGRWLARSVCMVFDKYLTSQQNSIRYSKII